MAGIRQLANQTIWYGLSNIVGRFINYLLTPILTFIYASADYGDISILFATAAFLNIVFTFLLTCLAWIFFRADTIDMAFNYLFNIFSFSFDKSFVNYISKTTIVIFSFFLFFEWKNRNNENPLSGNFWFLKTILVIVFLILFGNFYSVNEFIYFQF